MGITATAAEFLIQAHCDKVSFAETLTIGRQNLCISPVTIERILRRYGCRDETVPRERFYASFTQVPYFAEPFFNCLGARHVSSLDASGFEDASIVHNMNYPVPEEYHQRFDVVFDGGALEHVFNYPVAIKNCMEMTRVGGHVVLVTTVNNWLGHGFYQFSPSLFYGIFNEENGFEMERMFILENDANYADVHGYTYLCETAGPWYEVSDPGRVGERVLLVNRWPTILLVRARRIKNTPIFSRFPEESGYAALWENYKSSGEPQVSAPPVLKGNWFLRRLSYATRLHIHFHLVAAVMRRLNPFLLRRIYKSRSLRNRKFFRPAADRRR